MAALLAVLIVVVVVVAWGSKIPGDQWFRVRVVLVTFLGLFPAFLGFLLVEPIVGRGNPPAALAFIGASWLGGAVAVYCILSFIGWAFRN
jgi:hypothetical protein